jgi:hypothetical protein
MFHLNSPIPGPQGAGGVCTKIITIVPRILRSFSNDINSGICFDRRGFSPASGPGPPDRGRGGAPGARRHHLRPGDNVHRIFQSLNATGVNLTQADLLRNLIFMLLPMRAATVYEDV